MSRYLAKGLDAIRCVPYITSLRFPTCTFLGREVDMGCAYPLPTSFLYRQPCFRYLTYYKKILNSVAILNSSLPNHHNLKYLKLQLNKSANFKRRSTEQLSCRVMPCVGFRAFPEEPHDVALPYHRTAATTGLEQRS